MDAQYAAAYPELYARHWWWRVREEILLAKIRRLLAGATPARILDVGCGAALFFESLQQFGTVEGIESDRESVQRSGKWRSLVVAGELDDAYVPKAPFDLILMLDVLEHSLTPQVLLQRAAGLLTAKGRILVTVPAFKWLWTAHDDINHHVTRYTADELEQVIRDAGLATCEIGYMFQSLVLPKLLVRAREAISTLWGRAGTTGATARSPKVPTIPPPLVNRAVQVWFRAEYSVAGWLPFGGSLVAIAARHQGMALRSVATDEAEQVRGRLGFGVKRVAQEL